MKIAVIHPYFASYTGAENLVIDIANGMVDAGHDVTVFSFDIAECKKPIRFKTEFAVMNMHMNTWKETLKTFREKLPEYDMINYYNYPSGFLVQLAMRKMKKKPLTMWYAQEPYDKLYEKTIKGSKKLFWKNILNPQFQITRWVDKKLLPRTDILFGNSHMTAKFASAVYKKEFLPMHCVRLKKEEFSESHLKHKKEKLLFAIGRLDRKFKNVETVLEAFAMVLEKKPDYKLVYAGSGRDEVYLRQWVTDRNLEKSISLPGFISDEDVVDYYKKASLVLNLPLHEPFGLIAIEPAPYGTPVLNSTLSGSAEILKDRETAYLCEPKDPKVIADRIIQILDNPQERQEIAKNAFFYGKEHYTIDSLVKKLLQAATTHLQKKKVQDK